MPYPKLQYKGVYNTSDDGDKIKDIPSIFEKVLGRQEID